MFHARELRKEKADRFEGILVSQLTPVVSQRDFLVEESASLLTEQSNAVHREQCSA
jgi:hypothetical protein